MMSQPSSCLGVRGGPSIKGDDTTGPNPTDRGKPGTKRYIVVDRAGLPLALILTRVNATTAHAINLGLTSSALLGRVEPNERKGVVHQLANEDQLKWVPGNV